MKVKLFQAFKEWKIYIWLIVGKTLVILLLWIYWRSALQTFKFVWSPEHRQCVLQSRNYELEEKSSPLYVTLKFHGRLGNWMYSYASLIGIGKANGYIPYLSSTHPLVSYFPLTKIRSSQAECLHTVYDDRPCTYNPIFFNLPASNISIDSYVQSWKYFRFIDDDIRKEFKMHAHLKTAAREQLDGYVGKYLKEGRIVISVHVRRGDMSMSKARKLGFCNAPVTYFQNAMSYMLEKYPNSVFFVTSDDIEWCIKNLKPPKIHSVANNLFDMHKETVPVVYSKSEDSWEDFAMLTLCNHSIISVGTFGWWSAWLANGHVVYYKDFPIPGTKIDYETNKADFFPSHWVGLSSVSSNKIVRLHCIYLLFGLLFFSPLVA